MELTKQFIAFVAAQPADLAINHTGFDTCAIGAFTTAHHPTIDELEIFEALQHESGEITAALPGHEEVDNMSLMDVLNLPCVAGEFAPTYGHLMELVNQYYPQLR